MFYNSFCFIFILRCFAIVLLWKFLCFQWPWLWLSLYFSCFSFSIQCCIGLGWDQFSNDIVSFLALPTNEFQYQAFRQFFFMWEFNLSVRILITPLLWFLKPKLRSMFITEPSTNKRWAYPRKTTLSKLMYSNEMWFFKLLSWIVCMLFFCAKVILTTNFSK